jgi:hypothetical protein
MDIKELNRGKMKVANARRHPTQPLDQSLTYSDGF